MRGQMFVVTVIFLAEFVFFVQQALFQYAEIPAKPQGSDLPLLQDIIAVAGRTVQLTPDCAEADARLLELEAFLHRQVAATSIDIQHATDCQVWETPGAPAVTLTLRLTGPYTDTSGVYQFPHAR